MEDYESRRGFDEVLGKRQRRCILDGAKWFGGDSLKAGYIAVQELSRFLGAVRRRLQRLCMPALRRRHQRARYGWSRVERTTELLSPPVSLRHPWPNQPFSN